MAASAFAIVFCGCVLLVSAQNDHLAAAVEQQAQAIASLEARVLANENTIKEQVTTIQNQANTIQDLQTRVGNVETKQGRTVGFYADFGDDGNQGYRPNDINITANTPVVFNVALLNVGGAYNSNTGYFTAPYSGLYTFHLHFMGGAYNDTTQLDIVARGSSGDRYLGMAYAVGNAIDEEDQGSGSAVAHLSKGETVHVQSSYYDAMIWASALSSFSGMLVHAD